MEKEKVTGLHVFDASAILAFYHGEPGTEVVSDMLSNGIISAVNYAEVFTKLQERGFTAEDISVVRENFKPEIVEFTKAQAMAAAELRLPTRKAGLSLGDRACLALAAERKAVAVTTDRAWARIDVGIKVLVIR
jgi:ribonuclease VapC